MLLVFAGVKESSYAAPEDETSIEETVEEGSDEEASDENSEGEETEEDSEDTDSAVSEKETIGLYFECTGGFFDDSTYVPDSFTKGESVELPSPKKKGFVFVGWTSLRSSDSVITDANDAIILRNAEDNSHYVRLYAKWEVPIAFAPQIISLSNPGQGIIDIKFAPFEHEAAGFQLQYDNSGKFTDKVRYKDLRYINGAVVLKNKIGQRSYCIRVRSYVLDSTGERVYSEFSYLSAIYVMNGATEVEPTPTSGIINSVRIEGGSVVVDAVVEERVAAYDDCYYLVKVDPISNAVYGPLTSFEKEEAIVTSYPVAGNLMSKVALAVKEDESSYTLISSPRFIDNPEALASYTAPYPTPASKKGRQGSYSTEYGDKHFFHNLYVEELIASPSSYDVAYNYNGKTYYFYTPTHHIDYNSSIRAANADGGTVTMQVMIRWSSAAQDLICPTGRTPGYNFYAFNMEEASGREKVEALFMFLAEYWSKSNLHVDNWILGNEVNTFLNTTGRWYWAGNISRDAFMTNYSNTFRCLYYAVKSHSANSRVFTCTDHTWNDRDRDWGTRGFISAFDSYLDAMNPNIQWNLAYHAYTAVLTNADPWNDGNVRLYSVAHNNNASFVSPYNLEVLTNYVSSNFGSNTRIILSEVGFSYTNGTNPTLNGGRQGGADVQAAATAYLYYKAHFSSNIDACIFHTGDEGEAGKNFRIEGMPAGDVYKYMDTPSYWDHTSGYLGLINGATSWESIIPGFNGAALSSMPSR